MNVFILDKNLDKLAQYHCNSHCIKQILEAAQVASTALRESFATEEPWQYRSTHKGHPVTVWAGANVLNLAYICYYGIALSKEYTFRYGKQHKCEQILDNVLSLIDARAYMEPEWSSMPQCMPDQYRVDGDPVKAYRAYYNGEKRELFNWKGRDVPAWIT